MSRFKVSGMMFIILWILVELIQIDLTLCASCACATTNVHVRDGAGTTHTILTTLQNGHCLAFKGHRQTVDNATWVNVDYNGKDGWIHEHYVHISACSNNTTSHTGLSGCPRIISRAGWGARAPTSPHIHLPHTPTNMYIHHGASGFCHTETECKHVVKSYQNYHMDGHGWSDIGYSFVVGEDGNAYEARGWDAVGAHTYGHNYDGLAICVIGDFTHRVPNDAALNTVKQLIACGVAHGKLTSTYTLKGHRDVGSTACPGQKLYELIQHWPHYHH